MGSVNIVEVVLDDVGFGQLGCYGSSIETPSIDRIAEAGVRFTNFHTTTICSSSRASFLTGRNHHAVGIGTVIDFCTGEHPGYTGRLSREATTTAEVLRGAGYATMALGKWHLAAPGEAAAGGSTGTGPLARGFDHFYGFLGGATSQWEPDLVEDDRHVVPPRSPEQGYHLSEDLVDRAIELIGEHRRAGTGRPFYLHLAFGCAHDPHHAPETFIERYRGRFDHGWDVERARVAARQRDLGLVPADATIPGRNEGVPAWDSLGDDQRRVFARMEEVFAGFLTHTDEQIGRLVAELEAWDLLDETMLLVMSDNGASAEGGRNGYAHLGYSEALAAAAGRSDTDRVLVGMPFDTYGYLALGRDRFEDCLAAVDELGSPAAEGNYPQGWAMAGNTPFRRYKGTVHYGGIRCPLIVRWPGHVPDPGALRHGFHHAVDVHVTLLDAAGVSSPLVHAGVPQRALDGVTFRDAIETGGAPIDRVQYFEMLGHRGIYANGWKAVCFHHRGADPADDVWELYDTTVDPTECHDLAGAEPKRLEQMVELWWSEAERNLVLPMCDFAAIDVRFVPGAARSVHEYRYGRSLGGSLRPALDGVAYEIRAEIEPEDVTGRNGVLVADGTPDDHRVLWLTDGVVHFELATRGRVLRARTSAPIPRDGATIAARVTPSPDTADPTIELLVDDGPVPTAFEQATGDPGDESTTVPTLDLGADLVGRSGRYRAPFPYEGTLRRVVITTHDATLDIDGRHSLERALDRD